MSVKKKIVAFKRKSKKVMPTIRISQNNLDNLKKMAVHETVKKQEPVGIAEFLNDFLDKELEKRLDKIENSKK